MKHLKMLGLAALSAMALMAFASTASATTLEVGGVTKNESITITMSLKSDTSLNIRDTFGFTANTCIESHAHGSTISPYTNTAKVTGVFTEGSAGLSFGSCDHTVSVHSAGQFIVEWIEGTTNGRVWSENAEVTVYSTLHGTHINCTTSKTGTPFGVLTGKKEGHAEIHINATINCGPHLTSAKWTGTYTVTTPTGLGVSP